MIADDSISKRVDRRGVRKASRPEQARSDDVVNEVGDADQPRARQKSEAAAEKLVAQRLGA